MDTYFMLTGAGGYPAPPGFIDGTISYAGGSAALVGKNIGISHILENLAGASGPELVCENCTLTFTTGPFAGTVPHDGTPDGYSFSGGGSLQIIGGFRSQDGSVSLPANTVLLKAVPTGASTVIENGPLPVLPEVMLEFKHVVLHPKLRSLFPFRLVTLLGSFSSPRQTRRVSTLHPIPSCSASSSVHIILNPVMFS